MANDYITKRLLEDTVTFGGPQEGRTGAQTVAADHVARDSYQPQTLPKRNAPGAAAERGGLQQGVEQFLFHQAELLDGKHWRAYIDLFAGDGVYWMPITPEQTEWLDSPSIFAEDRMMMEIRMGRVMHPNAWSQAAAWGTSHIVGNVVVESASETQVVVRSRFQMLELRRDVVRHFGGTYRHTLVKRGEDFTIRLQRVDLLNSQAIFDYVLQVWV